MSELTGDELEAISTKRHGDFLARHFGTRPREAVVNELYGIYLSIRAAHPECTDETYADPDPWPMALHLADVLDKYLLPKIKRESDERTCKTVRVEAKAPAE